MRSETIQTIKKRYRREWLLIAVDKIDKSLAPVRGKLIAHSPKRKEIYQTLLKSRPSRKVLVEYSEDSFPRGYAAAFC